MFKVFHCDIGDVMEVADNHVHGNNVRTMSI